MIAKGAALKCFLIVLVCAAGSYAVDCNGFQHRPSDQQVPEGAEHATFHCFFNGSTYVAWFINGTGINEIFESPTPPMAISSSTTMIGNAAVNTLTIGALPEYSGIVVTCQAYFLTPNLEVCNATGVLLIRAPPGPVDNLKLHPTPTELQLTWERSLVNTDCTVLYCIDVFKVVGGKEMPVHAECIVDQTNYVFNTSESQPDPNDLFQFTVTPRYNVDGARNGTSTNVTGYFTAEPLTLSQESVSVGIMISRDLLVTLTITFRNAESWIAGGRMVDRFLIKVVLDSGQSYNCSPGQPVVTSSSTLSLDANCSGLPVQRNGSVTVTAINRVGNSSLTAPLSMYFVQDIRTQPCHSSQCQVEVIYNVVGDPKVPVDFFILLYNKDNDTYYFVGRRLNNATHGGFVSGLPKNHYSLRVFEFPLNKSGLPSRIPANPQSEIVNITMANSTGGDIDERSMHLEEFKHTGGGCFQCWFSSNYLASHCAVVVHTFGEVVNVSVFERSGDRAGGCTAVDSPGWYRVVALPYTNSTNRGQPYKAGMILFQEENNTPSSATITVIVTVAVVAVVALVALSSAYVGRKCYLAMNARRHKDAEQVQLGNVQDAQIALQEHHAEMELHEKLQAVTTIEELLSCFRGFNPDWSAVCDVLVALDKHELAGRVYTDHILPKLREQEQGDSGRYTLTTSTVSAGIDNGGEEGVPTQNSEGDKFGDAQSEHGKSGASSVVPHVSDPSKDLLAESAAERAVHQQATGEADDGSNYDNMLRQQTLSTIPSEGLHHSIQNEQELYPAPAEEGKESDVIPFFNQNPTN